jgi:F0F1-type ATP synthase alpha subunit
MQLNPSEISELIKTKIQHLDTAAEVRTQGTVVSVSDGICRIHGLSNAMQAKCSNSRATRSDSRSTSSATRSAR